MVCSHFHLRVVPCAFGKVRLGLTIELTCELVVPLETKLLQHGVHVTERRQARTSRFQTLADVHPAVYFLPVFFLFFSNGFCPVELVTGTKQEKKQEKTSVFAYQPRKKPERVSHRTCIQTQRCPATPRGACVACSSAVWSE